MPFVLIIAGIVLLVAATRNTQQQLFFLLAGDFTGQNNFVFWFISILIIGAVGYVPRLKPLSDGFLILVILVLFIKKDTGFFARFQQQISSTESASPNVSAPGGSGTKNVSTGGSSGVGIRVGLPSINLGGGSQGVGINF